MPGVYALIIGASRYPHLQGGSAAADDTLGLGQLVSSASTAAGMFEWLRTGFRLADVPPVWCYLLLSPTAAEETALQDDVRRHHAGADHHSMARAIQTWTGHLPTGSAAGASRSLFFFSGHGVQSNWDQQLLPSDYLNSETGAVQLENCIDTRQLRHWMETHPAAEHLALIDACRNEFSPLAGKGARGHTVFPVNRPGGSGPRTAAMLSAASPDSTAYQVPGRLHTFFGQAVLEALYAVHGAGAAIGTALDFPSLVRRVQPRINELLREAGGTSLTQAARPSIDGDDSLIVTETPPGPHARAPVFHASIPSAQDGLESIARTGDWTPHLLRQDLALYSLQDGQRLTRGARVTEARSRAGGSIVDVLIALPARHGGVMLVLEGDGVPTGGSALRLPTDGATEVPVRLTISRMRANDSQGLEICKVEAWLGAGRTGVTRFDNVVLEAEAARHELMRRPNLPASQPNLLRAIQHALRSVASGDRPYFSASFDMLERQARFLLRLTLPVADAADAKKWAARVEELLDASTPAGDFVATRWAGAVFP
ncbi:MAG: caspase family protein [Comamonadaceae bacterium]|nr:MAG: caspase family protein [Comamonadaceae bacterium]